MGKVLLQQESQEKDSDEEVPEPERELFARGRAARAAAEQLRAARTAAQLETGGLPVGNGSSAEMAFRCSSGALLAGRRHVGVHAWPQRDAGAAYAQPTTAPTTAHHPDLAYWTSRPSTTRPPT